MTWEGMGENNSVNQCHCNPEDKERLAFGVTVGLGIREGTAVSKNRTCPQLGDTVWVHVFFSFNHIFSIKWSFPSSSMVSNPPAIQKPQEARIQSLHQEDPWEEKMATHSSILAWKILWREKHGLLQAMGLQRVRHNWSVSVAAASASETSKKLQRKWYTQTYSVRPPSPWYLFI